MNDTIVQPTIERQTELLRPLIHPLAVSNPEWAEHVWAAIVWSHLTEPADVTAGSLAGLFGYAVALDLVLNSTADEIRAKMLADTGWQMMNPDELDEGLKRWRPRFSIQSTERSIAIATQRGMRVLTNWDEQWPEGFDGLGAQGPHCLWVMGDVEILHLDSVALVGARAASSYGEHVTAELAADLAGTHVIVSGAAYGIDGAAHRAALATGGKTVAYLAGGSDRPYPAGHAQLIDRIAASGAVVSEVPPGSTPTKWRFLARNRLIAAHANATIVVEAGWRSGSLNTAGHAVSLNRPLGAVPGPVTSVTSAGPHRILREMDGICITSAADVRQMLAGS
jgi:DNA processing protein